MAAREMGGLSLSDALLLCELLANADPARYERAALRWLQRFIDERSPPLTEVSLAASAACSAKASRFSQRAQRGLLRVSVLEEGCDRPRRSCDNDDRPQLKRDVKRAAGRSDRILQLGGHR